MIRKKPSSQRKLKSMVDKIVAFASLDVRELGRIKAELWKEHTLRCKELVLEAARLVERKKRCIVIGAGPCYDIPLLELAQLFEVVELLDLNPMSLNDAVSALPEALQSKVNCRAVEVTHALPKVLCTIEQEFQKAGTRSKRALNKAIGALQSQRVGGGELEHLSGDFIVSDMILSQLPTSLWMVEEWYQEQFHQSVMENEQWVMAMSDFRARLQSAHVAELRKKKGAVVLLLTDFGVGESADDCTLEALDKKNRITLSSATLQTIYNLKNSAEIAREWTWHRDDNPPKFSPVWGVAYRCQSEQISSLE